jgi:Tol biopolymer transport system component
MTPEHWEHLAALYEEASALDGSQRAAFLQNACRDDVDLRQELESLLASDGAATGFLGAGALTDAAMLLAADTSVSLAGKELAHYRVLSLLGSGGMGDVYRARDSRLGRDVAIKTIPGIFMSSEGARRRFEEEARAIASLSHPNVRALYDIGEVDGRLYAVLELLEGETLRERLGRAPLPVRKALEIGGAIAEGLAAAHNKGIVHRDLKPENVFLTSDGHVKVLDFGLATMRLSHEGDHSAASVPESRVVGGTVGYMSPEQVAQEGVDARSDLFSLGCVLFEMVSGRRLFQRATAAATTAAIVGDEPVELDSLGADLRRILARCLEKKPEARFQSARDLAFYLRTVAQSATESSAGGVTRVARWQRRAVWFATAAAGVAAVSVGLVMSRRLEPSPALHSYLLPPANTELCDDCGIALSPDGRRLAFVAGEAAGSLPSLWVQSLSESSARRIGGTEGARFPFWSPDGRSIGFVSRGSLMRVEADGDSPQTVCAPCSGQGTWSTEGIIVFGQVNNPLRAVPASGGTPVPLTQIDRTRANEGHIHPAFLPGGRRLLFRNISNNDPQARGIYAASLDSPATTLILRVSGISTPRSKAFVAAGHLLFVQEDALMAVPFDATRLRVEGEPKPIAPTTGPFAVAGPELLAYTQRPLLQLAWVDRQGRETALPFTGDFYAPVLSHDGQRVAVGKMAEEGRAAGDIWVYDLARNVPTRLTTSPEHEALPVWSPDDEWVLFTSDRRGRWDQYRKRSSGVGSEELLSFGAFDGHVQSWSRDGQSLIGHEVPAGDLWHLSLTDGATPLFKSPAREWAGQLSPRGDYLAYTSDETGQAEIYLQTFPPSTRRWRVSSAGGQWPKWRGDGRELFFTDTTTRLLMAVDITPGSPSLIGLPKPLFSKSFVDARQWVDVTADGQRFIVIRALADATPGKLTLLQNWTTKLKQ